LSLEADGRPWLYPYVAGEQAARINFTGAAKADDLVELVWAACSLRIPYGAEVQMAPTAFMDYLLTINAPLHWEHAFICYGDKGRIRVKAEAGITDPTEMRVMVRGN
jgi:hypothetical protein